MNAKITFFIYTHTFLGSVEKHGGRNSTKGVFTQSFHSKRLRWRMQTFTMAVANVYDGGCKRLRERMQTFAVKRWCKDTPFVEFLPPCFSTEPPSPQHYLSMSKKITLVKEGKGVCVRQVDVRTASSSYCLPNRKRLVAFPALH